MHTTEVQMFDQPSGTVRGVVNTSITLRGKEKTLAHATILVGKGPDITMKIPASPKVDEIALITAAMSEFAEKVKEAHGQ